MKIFLTISYMLIAVTSLAQSPGIASASASGSSDAGSMTWVLGSISATDQVYEVLPVKLVYFKGARAEATIAKLSWKTASEIVNAGFDIQKSQNGKTFESIGWADGKGDLGGEYSFIDNNLSNTSYYRLKQVDLDGTSEYSRIVSVIPLHESVVIASAYPNPSIDGNLTLRLPTGTTNLQVIQAKGTIVRNHRIIIGTTEQQIQLPKSGLYLIKVDTPFETKTIRVIYP